MVSRWVRRHFRRDRDTEQRAAADRVWHPAAQFDPALRPIAWWRAL